MEIVAQAAVSMNFLLVVIVVLSTLGVIVSHPIIIGGLLILTVSSVGFLISGWVSAFFGFVVFIVLIGGMLVVFAYVVALIPNTSFSFSSVKHVFSLLFITSAVWLLSIEAVATPTGDLFSFQLEHFPNFSMDWGLVSVWLSVLLFVIIVIVAGICVNTANNAVVGSTPGSSWFLASFWAVRLRSSLVS